MVVMGVIFLVSQVLILREFLLAFQGNEFVIGIVLGSWLLLEALGSWLCGPRADRSRDPLGSFASLQAMLSILLPLTLLAIRTNRFYLGISPWEIVSYLRIGVVSLVLLGPLGLLNGAAFAYGCRLMGAGNPVRPHAAGKVYALESLGAFLGGLAFTLLLVGRLRSIEIAFSLGAVSMGCVLLLLRFAGDQAGLGQGVGFSAAGRPAGRAVCMLLLGLFAFGVAGPTSGRIHRWSMELRWRPLHLEESRESIYGDIAVLRLDEQWMVYQNGIPSITLPYPDQAALELLVHMPLLAHPNPGEVLIMGGGVGGAISEARKHPLRALYYTELDPLLIRMAERAAVPSVGEELGDPRTRVVFEDGRSYLRKIPRKVDAIIINMPDPVTLQLNRFYTVEFFRSVRRALRPEGVLALTMPGSSAYLSEEALRINRCVRDTLETVFPHVRALPAQRILFLASRELPVELLLPEVLGDRLTKRGVETFVVQPSYLGQLMDPWQGRWLNEALNAAPPARTNRDLTPALLFYAIAHKSAEVQPGFRRVFPWLENMRFGVILIVFLAMTFPFAFWLRRNRGGRIPALSFALLSTGFCGMTVEMIVILSFQAVFGYLYQWIGLLIAAFMVGLACGAFVFTGRMQTTRHGYGILCGLEGLQIGFLLAAAWGIVSLHGSSLGTAVMADAPKWVLLFANGVAGLLVGSEFPLANREAHARGGQREAIVGARFYALDLAGAWLGTVIVCVLWVPLFGLGSTLLFAAALKGCSLFFLYRSY
jgi:spermidine synthase